MDDYYAILSVDRTASADEITKKIRHEIGLWSKRASNTSELSRRQEAERRVQLLDEAKATLLDEASRRVYDQRLAAAPAGTPDAATPDSSGAKDWLELARRALAKNDYNSALYAAREARTAGLAAAEVWSVMSRANAGLGRLDDALYESQQAVLLDGANPDVHIDLGGVYEAREDWPNAYSAFEAAHRLIPAADGPRMAMAIVLGEDGKFVQAVGAMEALYNDCQDREAVGAQLALLLARNAEAMPQVRRGDEYYITSTAEISAMNQLLARARSVTNDPHAIGVVQEVQRYVDQCAARPFNAGRFVSDGLFWVGVVFAVITLCLFVSVPVGGLFTALISAALIGAAVMRARPPVWKVNLANHLATRQLPTQYPR